MTFKQNSYSRDFQTIADSEEDRDTCKPIFFVDAEAYEVDGQPHFRDIEKVEIIIPGNSNTKHVRYVSELDIKRWPKAYAAFKANQEAPVSGTPLEQWATLTKAMILRLKALGFRSVQDVARMSENSMREVGMGARGLQQRALAFVDGAARTALADKAIADAERFESRCKELESNNRALNDQLAMMGEQLREIMTNQRLAAQNVASTPQFSAPGSPPQSAPSPFAAFAEVAAPAEDRVSEFSDFGRTGPNLAQEPEAQSVALHVPAAPRRGRPPKDRSTGE